jgi:hypothetical protein
MTKTLPTESKITKEEALQSRTGYVYVFEIDPPHLLVVYLPRPAIAAGRKVFMYHSLTVSDIPPQMAPEQGNEGKAYCSEHNARGQPDHGQSDQPPSVFQSSRRTARQVQNPSGVEHRSEISGKFWSHVWFVIP